MARTLRKDKSGNVIDIAHSMTERQSILGNSWRLETGYTSLADAAYALISFKTPDGPDCYYSLSTIDKSGSEVQASLIRGPAIAGGTAGSAHNLDDDVDDADCPLTDIKIGGTLSGGDVRFEALCPGSSNPSSKPGGSSQGAGLIHLRKNTVYALRLLAKGGAVTLLANIVIQIPGAPYFGG